MKKSIVKENPFKVVQRRRVTEKSVVLEGLQNAESNPCVKACKAPKYVFVVDPKATKPQIAAAVESIYSAQGIKVVKVNTINMYAKKKRQRGRIGYRAGYKKAVVTLEPGDQIDNV